MDVWERIYKERGTFFLEPDERMPEIAGTFKKKGVKRVLDLGCGSGRHLVYLSRKGFDVYGIDSSLTGIGLARKWLKKERLKAHLKNQDIYQKLPYKNRSFDAIISTQVLHHNYSHNIKRLITEMERVLDDNGILFFTVPKFRRKRLSIGQSKTLKKSLIGRTCQWTASRKGCPIFILINEQYKHISTISKSF